MIVSCRNSEVKSHRGKIVSQPYSRWVQSTLRILARRSPSIKLSRLSF